MTVSEPKNKSTGDVVDTPPDSTEGHAKPTTTVADNHEPVSATAPVDEPTPLLFPAQHWTQLPELETDEDDDSALGENDSSTASLSSSILHYRTINGRSYHSDQGNAQYWVTNDDQSNEALDINHHVVTLLFDGKLHKAPLTKDVQRVVDIGTGTVGSIVDWPALFRQAYKCLKPGGYIESYEGSPVISSDDGSVQNTSAMSQWGEIFFEGGRKLGRSFSVLEDDVQKKGMEAAGFVDVSERNFKVPIGGWSQDSTLKEAGQYFQAAILQDIEGTLTFIANLLGWSKEEIDVFGAHYRREIRSKSIHAYFRQRVVWARKPLTS
ncbi:hypothetical protein AK830_g5122 [Neonectria ditissima]|uniref:Uncharacterized protein n=1 Tax=Neonectria ditissima TaxID=78410 RepID=A0A0P7BLT7_9HYPO|nr:hypothetical protein AK830_g5122 [Neonectria ditissima]